MLLDDRYGKRLFRGKVKIERTFADVLRSYNVLESRSQVPAILEPLSGSL